MNTKLSHDRNTRRIVLPIPMLIEVGLYNEEEVYVQVVDDKIVISKAKEPIVYVK